jgi:hypothetical protein
MKQNINEIKRMQQLAGLKEAIGSSPILRGTYTLEETKPGSGKFNISFGNVDTGIYMILDINNKIVYGMSGVDVQDLFQKMIDDQIERGKL